MESKYDSDSSESPSCYQRGGRVRKVPLGKKRVVRPAKKGNVQIVTVNVTRPVRARGNAPNVPRSVAPTTVQTFVQQPTAIQQPYSLASASGPYQSFGEANYQQKLGEYFKSMSEPNRQNQLNREQIAEKRNEHFEPNQQRNFNEIEKARRRILIMERQRIPIMSEFGSQTEPPKVDQLSKEQIAKKRLERFDPDIRVPIDFGGQTEPIKFGDFGGQTDSIKFGDFGSQTEPIKFSDFGGQTVDTNKNFNFAEMEKARKRLQPESKPIDEVVMDRTRKPTPPESKPIEEEYKEVPDSVREGDKPLPVEVPVELPVEKPVEPQEEKKEEGPRTYRRSKVEADMQRINDVVVGKGKASTGSKEAIRAILGKYQIVLSPSFYSKYALPIIIEKAIRRMQGLNVTDY